MCEDARVLADDNPRKLVLQELQADALVDEEIDDKSLFDIIGRDMIKNSLSVAFLSGEWQPCFPPFNTQVGGGVLVARSTMTQRRSISLSFSILNQHRVPGHS